MNLKKKKLIIGFLIVSLLTIYGSVPPVKIAQAVDSITNAKDTISSSVPSRANVTHTFDFVTGTTTPEDGYWRIEMPNFSNISVGNVTCGYGTLVASTTGTTIDCTAGVGGVTATTTKVVITGVSNPATVQSYPFVISNYNDLGELKERVEIRVVIVEEVYMSARVASNLTFTINGMTNAETVNGVDCDANTTATTTPFGDLSTTASTTVCQRLNVTTNADDGYTVTVEQSDELTSDSGSNINSFDNSPDNTGSTTPHAWTAPTAVLDSYHTYGHMGLTSDDNTLDSAIWGEANPYNVGVSAEYIGLNGTAPIQVMYHDGPSDGSTQNFGLAHVAYTAEISYLQEAGDYETTLTYICTPTF